MRGSLASRARAGALAATALAAAAAAGCGGASPDLGYRALFRVTGAQYVPGALIEDPGAAGPQVHSIGSANNRIFPGVQNKAISGTVEGTGATVLVGMVGDAGHWIVPVDAQDQMTPGDLTFSARASFSALTPAGPVALVFRAVDLQGVVGPSKTTQLTMASAPVDGAFVISLAWDNQADLDLHVVAPASATPAPADPAQPGPPEMVEIWSKRRNSLSVKRTPADGPLTPDDIASAGQLDFDSNSQCANDGVDHEDVVWTAQPPNGHYLARVDAFSLCGATAARWHLTVSYQGSLAYEAFGQMGDTDSALPHGVGSGLTVFQNDVLAQ